MSSIVGTSLWMQCQQTIGSHAHVTCRLYEGIIIYIYKTQRETHGAVRDAEGTKEENKIPKGAKGPKNWALLKDMEHAPLKQLQHCRDHHKDLFGGDPLPSCKDCESCFQFI